MMLCMVWWYSNKLLNLKWTGCLLTYALYFSMWEKNTFIFFKCFPVKSLHHWRLIGIFEAYLCELIQRCTTFTLFGINHHFLDLNKTISWSIYKDIWSWLEIIIIGQYLTFINVSFLQFAFVKHNKCYSIKILSER